MSDPTDARGPVRLVAVRDAALSVDEVMAAVGDASAGGVVVFVGTIRSADGGKEVDGLDYSAHPTAEAALAQVCADVAGRHDVIAVAATHRTGSLSVGDLATVVAASAVHRGQAFAAAQDLIDTLKTTVPIWKHQKFADGEAEWVGLP